MIRVASVPASHPYVVAISDPNRVAVLPDPVPRRVDVAGQWWPPRWLEPEYLRERVDEIDVLHVHFGFDAIAVHELAAVCDILADRRVPLVLTVHDLHNPHFTDAAQHRDKLDVLVPAAARVITLTDGAARVIADRWNRPPTVVPHPHLLPLCRVGAPRVHRQRPVVALHGKSLRANLDPWTVLDILCATELDVALRFDLDQDAMSSPRAPRALANRLRQLASRGVDVRVHSPFTDDELSQYLHEIDVLVLPYLFGTHSGWVEICHDAGVATVVPDCGHFNEQQIGSVFRVTESTIERTSLLSAVTAAVADARACIGTEDLQRRSERAAQGRRIRDQHVDVYRDAMSSSTARQRQPVDGGGRTHSSGFS